MRGWREKGREGKMERKRERGREGKMERKRKRGRERERGRRKEREEKKKGEMSAEQGQPIGLVEFFIKTS